MNVTPFVGTKTSLFNWNMVKLDASIFLGCISRAWTCSTINSQKRRVVSGLWTGMNLAFLKEYWKFSKVQKNDQENLLRKIDEKRTFSSDIEKWWNELTGTTEKKKRCMSSCLFSTFFRLYVCVLTQLSILISSADLTGLPIFTISFRRVLVFLTRFAFRIKKCYNGHLFSKYLTGGGVGVRRRDLYVCLEKNLPKNCENYSNANLKRKVALRKIQRTGSVAVPVTEIKKHEKWTHWLWHWWELE